MKKLVLILFAVMGIGICAWAQDKDSVGNDKGSFVNMDVESFARYVANDSVQVLDVRMVEEYADGHLEGAKNIDVFDADFIDEAEKVLDQSRPVAVYCRSGKRSAAAAQKLSERGYQVINLDGGILAWIDENRPLAR